MNKNREEEELESLLQGYSMMLYFTGLMVLYEPDDACIDEFWRGGLLRRLPVRSRNPLFVSAAADLHGSCCPENVCLKRIKSDFLKLFIGTGKMSAPPYESFHLGKEKLLFDKETLEVKEFYKSYGWKFALEGNIPDDHIGVEILFINRLIDTYISLDDEVCKREMRNEIARFIERHPLKWSSEWKDMVVANAETSAYRGIAKLIHASLVDISDILKNWG